MKPEDFLQLLKEMAEVEESLPDAACKDVPLGSFFASNHWTLNQTKRICYGCPERIKCLNIALRNNEDSGVWGGVLFKRGVPDETDLQFVKNLGEPKVIKTGKPSKEKKEKKVTSKKLKSPTYVPNTTSKELKVFIFNHEEKKQEETNSDASRIKKSYPIAPDYKTKRGKQKK